MKDIDENPMTDKSEHGEQKSFTAKAVDYMTQLQSIPLPENASDLFELIDHNLRDWADLESFGGLASEFREKTEKLSLKEAAKVMRDNRVSLDILKKYKAILEKRNDVLSTEIIPDKLEESGLTSANVTGIGRLQVSSKIRVHCPAENREAIIFWLRDNGYGNSVMTSIASGTLKALMTERKQKGLDCPENIIDIMPYELAVIVKVKN